MCYSLLWFIYRCPIWGNAISTLYPFLVRIGDYMQILCLSHLNIHATCSTKWPHHVLVGQEHLVVFWLWLRFWTSWGYTFLDTVGSTWSFEGFSAFFFFSTGDVKVNLLSTVIKETLQFLGFLMRKLTVYHVLNNGTRFLVFRTMWASCTICIPRRLFSDHHHG